MMLYIKYKSSRPCSFRQEFFKLHYENPIFDPVKINKRAQRALGRSPEEKVKGQGEAIILL